MENTHQKLSGELRNTPMDASLVYSSVSPGLNREETLSVQGKVLTDNSLEENLPSRRGQGLRVPVINLHTIMGKQRELREHIAKEQGYCYEIRGAWLSKKWRYYLTGRDYHISQFLPQLKCVGFLARKS